jgi:chorismate dehydratase
MMQKVKVTAVSYLNTKPFLYGLGQSIIKDYFDLSLDMPSVCAEKIINGRADLGLVPIAAMPFLQNARIVSDFCIGAAGKVRTVNLYAQVPLAGIQKILLDYQSRTSALLVKLLAKNYWNIQPEWEEADEGFINEIQDTTAGLVIGDRTFALAGKYPYVYDLAEQWQKFTALPFVFAVWVANKDLPVNFLQAFNEALQFGVKHRHLAVEHWQQSAPPNADLLHYFDECISYELDEEKKKAMELFYQLSEKRDTISAKDI